jgi:hypothetical protein
MPSNPRKKPTRSTGAWSVDELKATAGGNAGIGSDAGLPDEVRFAAGIVKLVRRQIAEGIANPPGLAVFLLEPNARTWDASIIPKRIPMLDNGLTPIGSRLWFVNEAVVSGKYVELDAMEDDELFRLVTERLQLGHVPAALVELRTQKPSVRFYPKGLVEPDSLRSLAITGVVTLNDIFAAVDHVHKTSLVTPNAHAPAGKLWVNGTKCHPIKKAEDYIQLYLRVGLATWFPTCDIRWEERSVTGRLDLKIEESDALDKTQFTRHAILELKVLRSYGSTGNAVSPLEMRNWVKSGITQASSYGKDWGARRAALCCFDMRSSWTGEKCFVRVRKYAKKLSVDLRLWFLFGTSARYRDFLASGKS